MDEKIHVIAVGENPLEMILSPFELLRPDMVYVLIPSTASPDQEPFHAIAEKLVTFLRSGDDLHWIKVDFSDLKSILLSIAWIFGREKQRKNKVFVNLALGGSKVAVGLTISCCLFHGEPYYITTDPSTHIVSFPYIVEWLALRPYDLPTMNQIRILDLIQDPCSRKSLCSRKSHFFVLISYGKFPCFTCFEFCFSPLPKIRCSYALCLRNSYDD